MLTVLEGFAIESSFKKWMNLTGRWRPDWWVIDVSSMGCTKPHKGHAQPSPFKMHALECRVYCWRVDDNACKITLPQLAPSCPARNRSPSNSMGYSHHLQLSYYTDICIACCIAANPKMLSLQLHAACKPYHISPLQSMQVHVSTSSYNDTYICVVLCNQSGFMPL
jgi:hypothetical protein